MRSTIQSVVCGLVLSGLLMGLPAHAQADPVPEVPGIIGMTEVIEGSCIGVYVPMQSGEAIDGVTWYNNDEHVVYPEVLIASGVPDVPEPVTAAYVVAEDVTGASSGWSSVVFNEPIAASSNGFYVVFRLPEGSEHTAYGAGGGAGIGYTEGANGYTGWLSDDGADWVMLDAEFGIALVPSIIPAEEGMVDKSAGSAEETPVTHTAILLPAPNPFNPQTELRYQLKSASDVDLSIYNVRGERIVQLASGLHPMGRYSVVWRGGDAGGRRAASGVYFARFVAGDVIQTQRLLMVK